MFIGLHVKYRYSCQVLMKLEFYGHIFGKYSNIKFYEYPSSGEPSYSMRTDGQTDRHDEASNRFWHLSNAPKKLILLLVRQAVRLTYDYR